jgi:hypothetical protein
MGQLNVKDIRVDVAVVVRGINSKGKDRVLKHGCIWITIKHLNNSILLRSAVTGYRRWIWYYDDPDFELVEWG